MPINRKTDEQDAANAFNAVPLGNRKGYNTDTHNNVGEPQRCYTQCKKPEKKK